MNAKEQAPKTTVDMIRQYGLRKPGRMGLILATRLMGRCVERTADLIGGERMQVKVGETVSNHLYLTGDFEPEVSAAVHHFSYEGAVVDVIGAHFGTRVVQANSRVGKNGIIAAFEPTPRTMELLVRNTSNLQASIVNFPYALGDRQGETEFMDYGWAYSGSNTAAAKARLNPRWFKRIPEPNHITVPIITLDAILSEQHLKPPDLMVVDAEGFELPIFRGAAQTLECSKPIVIFETGDIGASQTLLTIQELQGHGYVLFEWGDDRLQQHDIQETYPDQGNLIAIHPQAARGAL